MELTSELLAELTAAKPSPTLTLPLGTVSWQHLAAVDSWQTVRTGAAVEAFKRSVGAQDTEFMKRTCNI
jgi:hypothetical protein